MGQNLGIGQSIGQNPGNGNNGNNGISNPGSNGGIVTNGYSDNFSINNLIRLNLKSTTVNMLNRRKRLPHNKEILII